MDKEKNNTEAMSTDEKINLIFKNMVTKDDIKNMATKDDLKTIEMKLEYLENKYDYTQKSINLLEKQMRYMESGNTEFRRRSTRSLVHVPNSVISDEFRLLSDDDLL